MNIQFNVAEIELFDIIWSRMFTSVKCYLLYFLMFTVTTNNLLKHQRRIYNLDIPGGSGHLFSRPALPPDTSSSTPSTISSSKQGADILPVINPLLSCFVCRMYGLFQTCFYFGYMAVFSLCLGILCGTIGYMGTRWMSDWEQSLKH